MTAPKATVNSDLAGKVTAPPRKIAGSDSTRNPAPCPHCGQVFPARDSAPLSCAKIEPAENGVKRRHLWLIVSGWSIAAEREVEAHIGGNGSTRGTVRFLVEQLSFSPDFVMIRETLI